VLLEERSPVTDVFRGGVSANRCARVCGLGRARRGGDGALHANGTFRGSENESDRGYVHDHVQHGRGARSKPCRQVHSQTQATNDKQLHQSFCFSTIRKSLCCLNHNFNTDQPEKSQRGPNRWDTSPTLGRLHFQIQKDFRSFQIHMEISHSEATSRRLRQIIQLLKLSNQRTYVCCR